MVHRLAACHSDVLARLQVRCGMPLCESVLEKLKKRDAKVRETNGEDRTCLEEEVERLWRDWGRNPNTVEFRLGIGVRNKILHSE